MGLLSSIAGAVAPAKRTEDDVLLLHGLMLMAGADGVVEDREWDVLRAYWNTLPDFRGKNFEAMLDGANKVVARFGGLKNSVKALSEVQDVKIKKKLFVLAADLAMSSGDIDQTEDELLETMARLLAIDRALATKVVEVLALKYAL